MWYELLALLSGVVISVMVMFNGDLSAAYGTYWAAVIVHIVGVGGAALLCVVRGRRIRVRSGAPLWAYLGGVIGVLTTLFNNFSFGRITMTSIVALGLLGQSATALVCDGFGWMGLEKRRVGAVQLLGFIPAIIGVAVMLDSSVTGSLLAVALSFAAGASVVFSRTVNARLAAETGPEVGSFINHLVGLPICIALAAAVQGGVAPVAGASVWAYLGGLLGVAVVLIFNVTVPRMPAFRLTLLTFTGQIFTGLAIDALLGRDLADASVWGGLVIAAGLLLNMLAAGVTARRGR